MARNADYTQEYFDIMESLGGDVAGRRGAYHSMQHSTAIYHGSVVDTTFTPRLYDARTYRALRHTAETMHAILCKVIEHYLDDPDYRAAFSFDERLVDLILLPRGYDSLLPFARVDIFLDEDSLACKFCEFNADGSSGMNEDREAAASIAPSATFQRFSARHEARPSELFDTWVDDFLRIYAGYEHRVEHPRMAICDFLENSVIDEFKVFAERFAQKGMPCSICDVRDLRFDGEALRGPDGERIDAVWRRCVTNDVIDHWEASQALIEAVRAQKVALIGSFAGHIVHDKQVFRVLSEPVTKAFLTAEEAAFIEQSIPFTTFLDDAHIDLDEVRTHKDAWIIKPTDRYGADEVHAGCYWDQESWDRLIGRFANGASGSPFLVQEYCLPYKTLTLPPDTGIDGLADDEVSSVPQRYNNLLGLYLYDGRFAGVFSRLGPLPTICKDMQGVTAATIWVDQGDGEGKDG